MVIRRRDAGNGSRAVPPRSSIVDHIGPRRDAVAPPGRQLALRLCVGGCTSRVPSITVIRRAFSCDDNGIRTGPSSLRIRSLTNRSLNSSSSLLSVSSPYRRGTGHSLCNRSSIKQAVVFPCVLLRSDRGPPYISSETHRFRAIRNIGRSLDKFKWVETLECKVLLPFIIAFY